MNKPELHTVDVLEGTDSQAAPDPFAPENLRLKQSFADTAGVKKVITTIPVRKPGPQDFFRFHPAAEFRENFPIIELKEEREDYLVTAALVPDLTAEIVCKTLFFAITRQGNPFLWPIRLPGPDGKDLDWWRSARDAAENGTRCWTRVKANMNLGAYEIFEAVSKLPDPDWPPLDFWQVIKIGFRDRLVDRLDHPVIKRLRGQT